MEWMLVNPHINTTFSRLGTHIGDKYCIGQNCHDTLIEILNKLTVEDCNLRSFRRAIGFSQVIKKDLLALLYNVKNDAKVIDLIVKILVNLTVPVECLLPLDVMLKTDTGRNTIYELNWLLTSCKEAFLDPRSTRNIITHIQMILDKGDQISPEDCESINNFLLLLRNILHIPEVRGGAPGGGASHQNQIVWNLFTQNLDKILIQLICNKNRSYWVMVMVQLVPLIYKDQHVGTLQKLLSHWFDELMSESSEDNESNTSPQEEGSGDSSSMMTSDPTSDSSDNGGSSRRKHKTHTPNIKTEPDSKHSTDTIQDLFQEYFLGADKLPKYHRMAEMIARKCQTPPHKHITSHKTNHVIKKEESFSDLNHIDNEAYIAGKTSENGSSMKIDCESSEFSDRGYGTQVENQESMSTSSNEDEGPFTCSKPVHQKPTHLIQKSRYPSGKPLLSAETKKEWRKKKLIKRSRKSCMNVKALLHHLPTDDEISHLLKEFTVDFLLKGYGYLVSELHSQLITNKNSHIDTSHFFWLVTYFLKFVAQLEIHLNLISSVLSFDIISYLTYEGLNLCEQLEVIRSQKGDINSCLRRIHLVVASIKEVVQTIEFYKKITHLSQEDKAYLVELQNKMLSTNDLKSLFVLLLHHFDPTIQSKQYLQDIIVTNHILLMFLEKSSQNPEELRMTEHIQQFASSDIIRQYGLLLEHFEENGEFINNCIFTIMHHVAGDLDKVAVLFQPSILKAFSKIREINFPVCEDWSDLIEYVINKFIKIPQKLQTLQDNSVTTLPDLMLASINKPKTGWSQKESNNLYWYYIQSTKSTDPIGKVVEYYIENALGTKSRIEVIEQLLKQEIINFKQYEEFMEKEPQNLAWKAERDEKMIEENNTLDDIITLRDHLLSENKGSYIKWVQNCLLETCYARLCITNPGKYVVEPIAHHCALLNQQTPLVTWNTEQRNAMQYQPFVLLLQKLGFHQPTDSGKLFAYIPNFWTPEYLYSVASKLTPINKDKLKFDTSLLNINQEEDVQAMESEILVKNTFLSAQLKRKLPVMSYTSETPSNSNWMLSVQQSKILMPIPPIDLESQDDDVDSDTDLTRMYVSDEESAISKSSKSTLT